MAITELTSHFQLNNSTGARSLIPPHLLNIWREEIREEIWRFNQVTGDDVPTSQCPSWVQPSRDSVARGLYTAYRKMSSHLGYTPLPQYFVEEIPLGFGIPVSQQQLQTSMGYVIEYGQRATTLLDDDATVTYSESNPGILSADDTATMTVASTLSADEIQIFFTASDSGKAAGDERFRIAPVTVTTDGVTITIVGHRALFVKPNIWDTPYNEPESRDINQADTSTAGDFVTLVDIYRVYTDTTTPVQYMSDPVFTELTDLEIWNLHSGLVLPRNNRLGIFQVRFEGSQSTKFAPNTVRVFYKAGFQEQYQRMDNDFAQVLMRLANTFIVDIEKVCDPIQAIMRRDLNEGPTTERNITNPFGINEGSLFAWDFVQEQALGRGGKFTSTRVRGAL
jgi:hypothetical protein